MKTLLVMCPNPADATSYWRGVGPFSKLTAPGWSVEAGSTDGSWENLIRYSAVFLQRPTGKEHIEILKRCKMLSIPTWVDYDDNLLAVPLSNPSFQYFARQDTQNNIKACLELATVVTVSTETLRNQLCPLALVIPNAWNASNLPFEPRSSQKTIAWRGSQTHSEDVLQYAEDIVQIYKDFPEYNWAFFGGLDWQLARMLPDVDRIKILGQTDVLSYFIALHELAPEWLLVPLKDSKFNRAKSDIAWLEATWAGAACIGPELPEWMSFGCLRYSKRQSMYQVFRELKGQAKVYQQHSEEVIVKSGRLLSDANKLRLNILESL